MNFSSRQTRILLIKNIKFLELNNRELTVLNDAINEREEYELILSSNMIM